MPPYKPINEGEKFGCYTVLGKSDKKGAQEFYHVKCQCGAESVIGKSQLRNNPVRCKACRGRAYSAMMFEKRKALIGTVVNGFRILDAIPSEKKGEAARFITECCVCGHKSEHILGNLYNKKGKRCSFCPPDYQFEIDGETAIGHLPDGTEFLIDSEDIPLVSKYHWYVNGNGYLFHRDAKTRQPYYMHRVILGLTQDDDMVVDHLNHNKMDNRKYNIRTVTQAENCMNNIKRCTNTSGYVGVRILENGRFFETRIEKGGVNYEVLKTTNIVDAAQAYNIAADYLFGVGIGYRNQVLYPNQEFACSIVERIKAIQNA